MTVETAGKGIFEDGLELELDPVYIDAEQIAGLVAPYFFQLLYELDPLLLLAALVIGPRRHT